MLDPKLGRFEAERRSRVREASATYLYFEPWVDELAGPIERTNKHLAEISHHIAASGINVRGTLLSSWQQSVWKQLEQPASHSSLDGSGAVGHRRCS